MEFNKDDFSLKIKHLRKDKKLSQDQLADMLSMKRTNIANYESARTVPPINIIIQLAHIFSVSVGFMLGIEEQERIPLSSICLHCSSILYNGECYSCLKERKNEMITTFDMFDSKTFPMTEERKFIIKSIIQFELDEINSKLEMIQTR
ncbi:helix-turn-helix domain-containing protein [Bacillus sp. 1P06AnD]|uniref:helix-turn-helix domain-containing protein n=1 Tax=Bacillus sp. 1P06AnD TaxID=3132208 RepID=UPI0039A1815C